MIRQRIELRTPLLAHLVRALTVLLGAALLWYGLMVVLLYAKVSPHTVNSISAYRTLYHDAAGLQLSDFTTVVRVVAGLIGLFAFLAFAYLITKALPRPHLTRASVELDEPGRGRTTVRPRSIERMAEIAAHGNANVTAAAGRVGRDELTVHIGVRRASIAADTLRDVQQRIGADLKRHELPTVAVNVTLTDYDPKTRRELA